MNKNLLFLLAIFLFVFACQTPVDLNQPIIPATVTPTVVTPYAPTQVPSATPTVKPTSSILPITPCGQSICEISSQDMSDVAILARLCVVEVRGFAERREDACQSIVSTVTTRMERKELSDGTVAGTIAWGCTPTTVKCQYPAYVVWGCKDIDPQACPWSYPQDILYFENVVYHFLTGRWGPNENCLNYLYYDSRPEHPLDACKIEALNGQYEYFHN